jgi:hypothetical protein
MANMLNNPEAISQAMSMITPEMMDQVSPARSHHVFVLCDTDVMLDLAGPSFHPLCFRLFCPYSAIIVVDPLLCMNPGIHATLHDNMTSAIPDPNTFLLLALALLLSPRPTAVTSPGGTFPNATGWTDICIEQIIASNPSLSSMGPQVREMMRSPMMRQMM